MSFHVPDMYRSPTKIVPLLLSWPAEATKDRCKIRKLGSRNNCATAYVCLDQKDRLASLVPTETWSRWQNFQDLHLLCNRTTFRLHPNLDGIRAFHY